MTNAERPPRAKLRRRQRPKREVEREIREFLAEVGKIEAAEKRRG